MEPLYNEIIQPSFAPPGWLFGPVWSFLYILIFISFGRAFIGIIKKEFPLIALFPLFVNIGSNVIWTYLFFRIQNFDLALLDILLVWASIVAIMISFWDSKRWISYIQIPYLLWVSFATCLMIAIWQLN